MMNTLKKATCILLAGTLIGTLSSCKTDKYAYGHYNDDLIDYETYNYDLKKDSVKIAIREHFFENNPIIDTDVDINNSIDDEDINKFLTDLNKRSYISLNCTSKSIREYIKHFIKCYDDKNLSLPEIIDKVYHEIDINNNSLTTSFNFNENGNEYTLFIYNIINYNVGTIDMYNTENIIQKVKYDDNTFAKKLMISDNCKKNNMYSILEEYNLTFNTENKFNIRLISTWNIEDKLIKKNVSSKFNSRIIIEYNGKKIEQNIDNRNDVILANILYYSFLNNDNIDEFLDKNKDTLSSLCGFKFKTLYKKYKK